jgi:hypothetical protein
MCVCNDVQSRAFFLISQLALLAFFLLQLPARLAPRFHPDLMDGMRGLCIGVAIAALAVSGWRNRRRAAP